MLLLGLDPQISKNIKSCPKTREGCNDLLSAYCFWNISAECHWWSLWSFLMACSWKFMKGSWLLRSCMVFWTLRPEIGQMGRGLEALEAAVETLMTRRWHGFPAPSHEAVVQDLQRDEPTTPCGQAMQVGSCWWNWSWLVHVGKKFLPSDGNYSDGNSSNISIL